MTRRKLLFVPLIFLMVGCTDTIETITREYRNTNNEVIDALMMVNSEATAKQYTLRVFEPMVLRYKGIDARLNIVRTNRLRREFVKEVLESDGFQLYLTDLEVNRQRRGMELTRLRNLVDQYVKQERDLLIAQGDPEPDVKPQILCPSLYELVYVDAKLTDLRDQLENPKLFDMIISFPEWKVEGYEVMLKTFRAKRKTFATPQIDLLN